MIKLLLCDLDGTIAETRLDIMHAINHALEAGGCPLINEEECRIVVGNGLRNALIKASRMKGKTYDERTLDSLFSQLVAYYQLHCTDYSFAYEGIPALFEDAKAHGIAIGVLSNKTDELVQRIVRKLFPTVKFAFVQGFCDTIKPKPAPDGAFHVSSSLGFSLDEIFYLGDSEVDWRFLQGVPQMHGAIADWGFRSRKELLEEGVTMMVDTPLAVGGMIWN